MTSRFYEMSMNAWRDGLDKFLSLWLEMVGDNYSLGSFSLSSFGVGWHFKIMHDNDE